MNILLWRILCLSAAGLFVVAIVLLFCLRLLKNKYYHSYTADELMRRTKTENSTNFIYFTSGETKKFIKKYVVCKSVLDHFLVCNYCKQYDYIKFYVIQYSRTKRVIAVNQVTETHTGNASKVFALHKRCAYVNIVVGEVDSTVINSNVIRPVSISKLRLYAMLKSAAVFLGLFVLRHVILEIFGGMYLLQYLNSFLDYACIGGSLLLCLIAYFITVRCFRRKAIKQSKGGVLEYEFV